MVGITRLTAKDELIGQEQFFGTLEQAAPGEYTLKSTGEVLVDPEFISTWILNETPQ
ncbi:MAG: hypothetical protein ACRDKI_11220 [Solirubrobacterales bacterium]